MTFATKACVWQRKQQVRHFKPPVSASQVAYKLKCGHAIRDLLERLDDISKEKADLSLDVSATAMTPLNRLPDPVVNEQNRRTTSHIFHRSNLVGRENDRNNVTRMLLSEQSDSDSDINISTIPILGMGGIGKTTLAQLIYNDEAVKNHFPVQMWVSDTLLETRLLDFLTGNRFLLVLDDVWNDSYSDWSKLETLLKHGGKGSKVLVTTRSAAVSDVMRNQLPYRLGLLPEDECWSLFAKIAFPEISNGDSSRVPRGLEIIGREIVNKCKCLPLAITAMGGLLRGNTDEEKWRRVLKDDIWKAGEYGLRDGELEILPALRLSYDHLSPYLKQCFAYCCLFPKGYVFDKSELVKLWKAASLIEPRDGHTPDDIGSDYFDVLLSRSLFQVSEDEKKLTYRMHDLIHDLALSVSTPYFYQTRDDSPRNIHEKVRHISLLSTDVQYLSIDDLNKVGKLRTLISPVDYPRNVESILDTLFSKSKYLRTLDLSSSMMVELPESVGKLKLLHYLDLSNTEIRWLPDSLCKLYNLQTLKLLRCPWLFELPKDFSNLVNLEHLELDDMFWHKSLTFPPNIGCMKRLQNLPGFQVGQEPGYGIDQLKDMLHLKGGLHISRIENAAGGTREANLKDKESLVKVVLEWSDRVGSLLDVAEERQMLEDLQPHPNIGELGISRYQGDQFPPWLGDSAFQKLTTLSLEFCKNCKILSLGQIPHLMDLSLKGLTELEEWSEAEYLHLRRLKISNCAKLKHTPSSFLNLSVLKIKKCDLVEALPCTPFLQFLILGDNLNLKDFNEVIICFSHSNGGPVIRKPSFIDLLEMKIINCPKLQQLPKVFAPQKLEISGCPLLTALPTAEFSRRLQQLAIDACDDGTLVREMPESSSLFSLSISDVQKLSSLPKFPDLPGLEALYIHNCNDLVSLSDAEQPFQGFDRLQLLSIRGCPKLETFPDNLVLPSSLTCLIIASCSSLKSMGPKQVLKRLPSLKDVYIENCPQLKALPEEGFPPSLQHLSIEGCPLLISQSRKPGPDWTKIEDIPDVEPDWLKSEENSSLVTNNIGSSLNRNSRAWYSHFICRGKGDTSGSN